MSVCQAVPTGQQPGLRTAPVLEGLWGRAGSTGVPEGSVPARPGLVAGSLIAVWLLQYVIMHYSFCFYGCFMNWQVMLLACAAAIAFWRFRCIEFNQEP